jgi:cysteine desulfurase
MITDVIYLDYNASTPCDPRVVEAMQPFFSSAFANPSSRNHGPGRDAFKALEAARSSVARHLGARSATEIVFTSGATESNNLALIGAAKARVGRGRHLVTQAAELAHARGALVHCDAAQGVAKIDVSVAELGVDLLSLSGHKLYAPKGIGALFVRRTSPPLKLTPHIHGGGHEGGMRSGTPNLPGAVALAHALEIADAEAVEERPRIAALRDTLEKTIVRKVDDCEVNGSTGNRLPNTSNLSFSGIEGNALLASLPDLAVSSGSACTSSHPEASPVLLAMGVRPELAKASLRLSLGRFSTGGEVERAANRIVDEVLRLRTLRRRPGR